MSIIVTESTIPNATPDNLLVVEPFNGTPVPANRLPVGAYYVQDNQFKSPNWQNLANILAPSLRKLLFPNQPTTFGTQLISTRLIAGTNTIAHTLGGIPSIIQFWQGNSLFTMGFPVTASATELTIESSDAYSNIIISLVRF